MTSFPGSAGKVFVFAGSLSRLSETEAIIREIPISRIKCANPWLLVTGR
jgi:hypothetical protein